MRLALALAVIATPLAAQGLTRAENRAASIPVEDVASHLERTGTGDLDPTLIISTQHFLETRIGTDHFFRAKIDKASGAVTYQLYAIIESRDAMRPSRVTYRMGEDLAQRPARRIDFDVSCYRSSCTTIEHAVVDLPESDVAAMGQCVSGDVIRFKVFGARVEGVDLASPCNELAGLILAVSEATE